MSYSGGAKFQQKMAAKLAALNGGEPDPVVEEPVILPVDTDPATWTFAEDSEAQQFLNTWAVDGRINCDCQERLCVRARALQDWTPF